MPEEGRVVGQPVERGRGQDRVDRLVQGQRLAQVRDQVGHPIAESGQPGASLSDHGRRAVEGDHPAVRQALGQLLGYPARAAASIKDGLVAGLQSQDDVGSFGVALDVAKRFLSDAHERFGAGRLVAADERRQVLWEWLLGLRVPLDPGRDVVGEFAAGVEAG